MAGLESKDEVGGTETHITDKWVPGAPSWIDTTYQQIVVRKEPDGSLTIHVSWSRAEYPVGENAVVRGPGEHLNSKQIMDALKEHKRTGVAFKIAAMMVANEQL